jgi:hypothetical protein
MLAQTLENITRDWLAQRVEGWMIDEMMEANIAPIVRSFLANVESPITIGVMISNCKGVKAGTRKFEKILDASSGVIDPIDLLLEWITNQEIESVLLPQIKHILDRFFVNTKIELQCTVGVEYPDGTLGNVYTYFVKR